MGIREEVYFEGGPHIGDLITNIDWANSCWTTIDSRGDC
jgi:hypothetical protein